MSTTHHARDVVSAMIKNDTLIPLFRYINEQYPSHKQALYMGSLLWFEKVVAALRKASDMASDVRGAHLKA